MGIEEYRWFRPSRINRVGHFNFNLHHFDGTAQIGRYLLFTCASLSIYIHVFSVCSLKKLREQVQSDHNVIKKKQTEEMNGGFGYGGKYGVEKDRMDKVKLNQSLSLCSCI